MFGSGHPAPVSEVPPQTSGTPSILCVGTVSLDLILVAPRMPDADERIEASDVALSGGGNAANAAVAIARLGLPVQFCGTVGGDRAGDWVIAELAAAGVGVDLVRRHKNATTAQSAVIVSSDSGERAIVTYPPPPPPPVPAGFDIVHLDKAGWVSMPPRGIPGSRVSVDDGNLIPDLNLSLLAWYVPTAAVIRERYSTPDAVRAARLAQAEGAECVIATEGPSGSFGLGQAGTLVYAPPLPVKPRSTLGAGDVFHGALLAALALGQDLEDALRFANVTAALACRGLDGRSAIPIRGEVESQLQHLTPSSLSEEGISQLFSRIVATP